MPEISSKFAINTYSYTLDHTVEACLRTLSARGYRQFELMMYPGHLWPFDFDRGLRRALTRMIAAEGLELLTANMPNIDVNIAAAVPEMRAYSMRNLVAIFELAGDLGIPGVIVGPGKANPLMPMPHNHMMGHFFAALDQLSPISEKLGVQILVENMPFAFLPGIDALTAALDEYGNPGIGVVYDIANGVFIKEDPCDGIRKTGSRLVHVHASDTPLEVYRHDPVGTGVVPFEEVGRCLVDIGYGKPPILEIISAEADAGIDDSARQLAGMGWDRIAG